jgi:hypothetical protein
MIWWGMLVFFAVAALCFFSGYQAGYQNGYNQHQLDTDPEYRARWERYLGKKK